MQARSKHHFYSSSQIQEWLKGKLLLLLDLILLAPAPRSLPPAPNPRSLPPGTVSPDTVPPAPDPQSLL